MATRRATSGRHHSVHRFQREDGEYDGDAELLGRFRRKITATTAMIRTAAACGSQGREPLFHLFHRCFTAYFTALGLAGHVPVVSRIDVTSNSGSSI